MTQAQNKANPEHSNRWTDGSMFQSTTDLSPECIERYMQRGRTMRAIAFRAMLQGGSGAAANDAKRATLKNCASRFDNLVTPAAVTA